MAEIELSPELEHASRQVAQSEATSNSVNVNRSERLISLIAGAAFVALAIRRPNSMGLGLGIAGGLLAYRGVTGHCPAYGALQISTTEPKGTVVVKQGIKVERAITIQKSPEELFDYWRNVENLPRFMHHLDSVTITNDFQSHWVAKAPAGLHVAWDAEIINERPAELLAWRSLPGADIPNTGSVHFRPAPGGRGTEVRVALQYDAPAGQLGAAFAKLLGEEPSVQIDQDLKRFKQLMEAGEIPTTDGQPHG